ncbi:hypothetical protein BJA01nite_49520 [Bradyrhizobium japonicum]|nr:hypothetical protein BJA01nite_49520 [Bradyrhizobium japonicum]
MASSCRFTIGVRFPPFIVRARYFEDLKADLLAPHDDARFVSEVAGDEESDRTAVRRTQCSGR